MSPGKPRRKKSSTPTWIVHAAAPAAVALLTIVAYAPALDNDLVYWDDHNYLTRSTLVDSAETSLRDVFTRSTLKNYRPLTILSWR